MKYSIKVPIGLLLTAIVLIPIFLPAMIVVSLEYTVKGIDWLLRGRKFTKQCLKASDHIQLWMTR
jgi:hypothetical protein